MIQVIFLAKGIKETKTIENTEKRINKFRINMLAKHNLLFKKEPHLIKINYGKR